MPSASLRRHGIRRRRGRRASRSSTWSCSVCRSSHRLAEIPAESLLCGKFGPGIPRARRPVSKAQPPQQTPGPFHRTTHSCHVRNRSRNVAPANRCGSIRSRLRPGIQPSSNNLPRRRRSRQPRPTQRPWRTPSMPPLLYGTIRSRTVYARAESDSDAPMEPARIPAIARQDAHACIAWKIASLSTAEWLLHAIAVVPIALPLQPLGSFSFPNQLWMNCCIVLCNM